MIFKYASHEFEQDNIPQCNICNGKLIIKLRKKRKPIKYEYYQLYGCTNCNLNNRYLKWKSLLPKELYNKIKLMYSNQLVKNHIFNINNYLKKGYSEEDAKKIISNIQKENSSKVKNRFKSTNYNLKKIGYTEVQIKNMRIGPNQIKYWTKKGYNEDDAKIKISEHQSKIAKGTVRKGTGKYPNQIEYWIKKGYNENDAIKKISERQSTFNLKKCIEKYGEIEGKQKWLDRQEKWMKNYKKSNFSKISQELFWQIYDKINKNDEIYFATLKDKMKDDSWCNNEYKLKLKNKVLSPDFFVKNKNKIIEFDGTYYHRTIPENKKRDIIRDIIIKENGYDILHVNESEYKENPKKIINDCFNFLNDLI